VDNPRKPGGRLETTQATAPKVGGQAADRGKWRTQQTRNYF